VDHRIRRSQVLGFPGSMYVATVSDMIGVERCDKTVNEAVAIAVAFT